MSTSDMRNTTLSKCNGWFFHTTFFLRSCFADQRIVVHDLALFPEMLDEFSPYVRPTARKVIFGFGTDPGILECPRIANDDQSLKKSQHDSRVEYIVGGDG